MKIPVFGKIGRKSQKPGKPDPIIQFVVQKYPYIAKGKKNRGQKVRTLEKVQSVLLFLHLPKMP